MPFPRISNFGRVFTAPTPAAEARGARFFSWRPSTIPRNNHRPWRHDRPTSRAYTTKPSTSSPTSRAERVLSRLPPSMQKYTRRLKDAPVSHVVAFLILHELTAIVPLIGLFGLFHYAAGSKLVPLDYMVDHYGGQVADGVRRFEKYFRRKGWFGFGEDKDNKDNRGGDVEAGSESDAAATIMERWASADSKYKIVVEVGLAYTITKLLLPLRIAVSLWATPWFAVVLARVRALRRPKT